MKLSCIVVVVKLLLLLLLLSRPGACHPPVIILHATASLPFSLAPLFNVCVCSSLGKTLVVVGLTDLIPGDIFAHCSREQAKYHVLFLSHCAGCCRQINENWCSYLAVVAVPVVRAKEPESMIEQ